MSRTPKRRTTVPTDDEMLTEKDLAARWKFAPASLANQRSQGRGPSYLTIGRSVRYRLSAIVAYERLHGLR